LLIFPGPESVGDLRHVRKQRFVWGGNLSSFQLPGDLQQALSLLFYHAAGLAGFSSEGECAAILAAHRHRLGPPPWPIDE
jgi:hypothetical protein